MLVVMKKLILILSIFFVINIANASNSNDLLIQAKSLYKIEKYKEASKLYRKYLKTTTESNVKIALIEYANCQFRLNNDQKALRILKKSFKNHKLDSDDLIYSAKLDSKLAELAWTELYDVKIKNNSVASK